MPSGGRLTIATRRATPTTAGSSSWSATPASGWTRRRGAVFEPFFTTRGRGRPRARLGVRDRPPERRLGRASRARPARADVHRAAAAVDDAPEAPPAPAATRRARARRPSSSSRTRTSSAPSPAACSSAAATRCSPCPDGAAALERRRDATPGRSTCSSPTSSCPASAATRWRPRRRDAPRDQGALHVRLRRGGLLGSPQVAGGALIEKPFAIEASRGGWARRWSV